MTAFYNEPDPYAAAWLENLIAAGHIAPGIVDRRPIQEIEAWELVGFTQCHFFAGIGVWSHALRRAGWSDDRPIWTGSCPCQPFSAAGQRKGISDERHLWPYWHQLIDQCRPAIVLGEQVASKDGLGWLDLVSTDLERADYAFGASDLCAAGFGGAHERHRIGFVADADNAEWWSERAPWHDGQWPQTGWVQGHRHLGDGGASGGLADADKKLIVDAVNQMKDYQRKFIADKAEADLKFLREQKMVVTEPDRAKFVAATKDIPNQEAVKKLVPVELVEMVRNIK